MQILTISLGKDEETRDCNGNLMRCPTHVRSEQHAAAALHPPQRAVPLVGVAAVVESHAHLRRELFKLGLPDGQHGQRRSNQNGVDELGVKQPRYERNGLQRFSQP